MRDFVAKAGVAGLGSVALALAIAVAVVLTLFPLTSDMPAWDQWSMAPVFEAHYDGRPVLPLLLANYNGHYNWLPRFLFYGMGLLSRWDTRLEVMVGFLWAACTLLVLLRMLWETNPRLLVLAAPFAGWVFSVLHFPNFLNGYGMGQLLAGFAAFSALYLLTDPHAGRGRFVLALVSGAAAFISHGAGLALAPVGLAVLLLVGPRRNWPRIATWTFVAAGGLALGVLGSRNTQVVVEWRRVPVFALTLLGRPFTLEMSPSPKVTAVTGAFVLLACVLLGYLLAREWPTNREVVVRWSSVALLALTVIGLIATNRSRAPFEWAQSPHYVTSTYPVGLALMALAAHRLRGAWSSRRSLAALALFACVAAPLAQQALLAHRLVPILRSWHALAERNVRRLALGTIADPDILGSLHPEVDLVRSGADMLRSRRLAWFAHAREARRPSGSLDRVSGRPATSTVELKQGAPWVFEGSVLPPLTAPQTPVQAVLVVDGVTVGAVPPTHPRPDLEEYYASRLFLMRGFKLTAPDGPGRPPGRYRARVVARAGRRSVTVGRVEVIVTPK